MKLDKVKGKLRENNITYDEFSSMIGMSVTTFNNKINGKNRFYIDEIKKISKILNFTDEEKIDIFLN
ncbi:MULTISPECIES: helix-turn-helix domain-containing protein [Paraclostridium]|uniref:helix-turn-helix domain-containing protein n=1 Tax=Paraclostridium TaxID=1849822 RepID=UPI0005E7847B|nr:MULTISPECIES: helix-turn-helix transcriptional regulator [Clostridia]MBZ6007564.1 helix-turn-helix domain-containing protein [Paraclostridium bifermentans]MDU0298411.1 helix-turn-helix transcriptional regulator [Paraclostridium sp. MRS3W1]MDU1453180.1 helix-turn-helix transcriptional regulator [Paeniclostridium sordellii]CEN81416.1 transcriptional regulator [[Clostridium] sordellii] [Paeniclostridium sordellii]CEN87376.1 transcriptional regulator [[Clostridium] sordellii] [Paeniclostridium 